MGVKKYEFDLMGDGHITYTWGWKRVCKLCGKEKWAWIPCLKESKL